MVSAWAVRQADCGVVGVILVPTGAMPILTEAPIVCLKLMPTESPYREPKFSLMKQLNKRLQ